LAPTGEIFMKFEVSGVYNNLSTKIQSSLKYDNNNGFFT
jgi:hypothetical protein